MRCGNCFNCSGKMIIKSQHDKDDTWVAAHKLPVFAQCDECGHAPSPEDQPKIVSMLLQEYIDNNGYKRDTTYLDGQSVEYFVSICQMVIDKREQHAVN